MNNSRGNGMMDNNYDDNRIVIDTHDLEEFKEPLYSDNKKRNSGMRWDLTQTWMSDQIKWLCMKSLDTVKNQSAFQHDRFLLNYLSSNLNKITHIQHF